MVNVQPFEDHWDRYEDWFDQHEAAYVSELLALRSLVPWSGRGVEIGVGSARFAGPLGIQVGVDPSPAMLRIAAERGVEGVQGTAEQLPLPSATFDHALVVTTICFVDSAPRMLAEAHRVLKPRGILVIGFIDRDSSIGRNYLEHQSESVFYRGATFFSSDEVEALLREAGFQIHVWGQTLFHTLAETRDIEPVQSGRGAGAFVVVSGAKGDVHT